MSRGSNSYTDIKKNKLQKKKTAHPEKNLFIATLESIKKEMGVKEITPEQFWSMQRNVSNFFNHRTVFRLFLSVEIATHIVCRNGHCR
jgi:hypothetical protein